MIVGFSSRGTGGGSGPVEYLTDKNRQGRDDNPPSVLRGSPKATEQLIDSLNFKHKYTSGVLSFAPNEQVTEDMEAAIMDRFEAIAFAGLESDQYNILWVRHEHANHHELHFVTPRVELSSGKSLNIRPPGELAKQTFDDFRSEVNARYGFADPDDPKRAREISQPNHLLKIAAESLRNGVKPEEDVRLLVNEIIAERAIEGLISNRSDVVSHVKELGFDVAREGKNYITIMEPESGERWRLKGGLYEREFDATREIEAKAQRTAREYGKPDAGAAEHFAQRVERHISSRAEYNQNRYAPAVAGPSIGSRTNEESNTLENHQRPSVVSSIERTDSLADYLSSRLGISALADKPDNREPTADSLSETDLAGHGESNIWDRYPASFERYVRRTSERELGANGLDGTQSRGNQNYEVNDDRARKPLTERITGFISTIQSATRELKERVEYLTSHVRAHFEGKRDIVQASRGLAESNERIKQANESIREPIQSEQLVKASKPREEPFAELRREYDREQREKIKEPETPSHKPNYPSMGM
ncbi:TPA: relaxase/mobilization nuclease domain-containing protein [Klebsiella pneumoniae]|nr:relaxase/mobilization nuclease domain-containing protein [Klebsiella pneumoniae]